jgi:hypothetical protein
MSDDMTTKLKAQVESEVEHRQPDLDWVLARGHKLRARRIAAGALGGAVTAILVFVAVIAQPWDDKPSRKTALPPPPQQQPTANSADALVEEVSEQEQAEIFAFRALATTELMGPFSKRSYNWTYEDDTSRTEHGWRIGFAASDCEPRDGVITCRGLSGEDPELGNALTDTYATVVLDNHVWRVVDVEGNMLPEERERVIGFTQQQHGEPSHWEFPAAGVWSMGQESMVSMFALWVGPYPTSGPGSVCMVKIMDTDGDIVGQPSVFYQEPPNRPFERGGWVRGTGAQAEAADVSVDCRQYTGAGWELTSEPQPVGEAGSVTGISAELEWQGDEGFTTAAVCEATLVDEAGSVVGEGSGRLEPLWRPDELKDYPYEATIFVNTRGEPIDAEKVGEFTCRSF